MEGPYPKSLAYPRRNLRHAYKHVINTTVQCYYYEYEVNIKQDIHVQIMNGYAYIVTWLDDGKNTLLYDGKLCFRYSHREML